MRRAARVDANQHTIVSVLRTIGCSVQHLHVVGAGCPDLMVGRDGHNYLLEVKDGRKPPSAQALTPDEQTWHERWRGKVHVVRNTEEALAVVIGKKKY